MTTKRCITCLEEKPLNKYQIKINKWKRADGTEMRNEYTRKQCNTCYGRKHVQPYIKKNGYKYIHEHRKRQKDELGDDYIKRLISKDGLIKYSEVTPDMIELKRKILIINEEVKENRRK